MCLCVCVITNHLGLLRIEKGVPGFRTLSGNSGKVPVPTRTNWSLSRVGRCCAVCVNAGSDLYGVLLIVFNSDGSSEDENEII